MKYPLLLLCALLYNIANAQPELHLNQIQIIASHNSYKKKLDPRLQHFLDKNVKRFTKRKDAFTPSLDYEHLPFDSQFANYGIRGLEIDIYNDPKGGAFYKRRANAFVHGLKQNSGVEELKKPGFKVLHIKDIDYQTWYYTFKEALAAVKKWSDENPRHLPLFINIESKNESAGDASGALRFFGFKRAIRFDEAACDSIDAEIKSVFGNDLDKVLTPDRVRGKYATLNEMATSNGWPLLKDCMGKVIFIMEGGAVPNYVKGHPSLQGRAIFTYAKVGEPECAFTKRNEAQRDMDKIKELVKQGYIIRTRADSETIEERQNDYTRMNMAFESGGQIVSTDYYKADMRFNDFHVRFPHGEVGRKNPVNATQVPGPEKLVE